MIVSIVSIFTFAACSLTNKTTSSTAMVDADGRLRLSIPFIYHNTYSEGRVIDDNSGSFTWELEYYYAGNKVKYPNIKDNPYQVTLDMYDQS